MEMEVSRAVLRDRFNSLAGNFAQLGSLLLDAAAEMQKSGRPLSDAMLEELQMSRKDFEELRAELLRVAEYFQFTPLPKVEEIPDLNTLESLLEAVIEAITAARLRAEEEERKAQEARRAAQQQLAAAQQTRLEITALLKRVLELTHKTRPQFKPLQECHAQASKLHETIAALTGVPAPLEEQTLREAQKPYQSLIYLVEEWNNLEGDQWDALREEVSQYFGKELAAQAARGQLYFQTQSGLEPANSHASAEAAPPALVPPGTEKRDVQTPGLRSVAATSPTNGAGALPAAGELADAPVENPEHLPFTEWAGGNWPTLEEMAKALMDGKLALAADSAAESDLHKDEFPDLAPATALPNITGRTAANNAQPSKKTKGKGAAKPAASPELRVEQVGEEELPAWFNRLDEELTAEDESGSNTNSPPNTAAQETPSQTGKKSARVAAKGSASKKASSQTSPSIRETFSAENGSTITQVALSHWSKLLEDLSAAEAAAAAREQLSAAAPPEQETKAEALPAPELTTPAVSPVEAPKAVPLSNGGAKPAKSAAKQIAQPVDQTAEQAAGQSASPSHGAAVKPSLEEPLANGKTVEAAPTVPPPPPPPPVVSMRKVEDWRSAEPGQDFETVPPGQEDAEEREQTLLFLALEEQQAPFYFAEQPAGPLYQLPAEFKAPQIASAIESGAAPERLVALRDLLWRLLLERQLGLAFLLARALERLNRHERICLPSWLVRTLAVGPALRFDEGELAQQLRADLKLFTPGWINSPNAEWNLVISLLTAAGSLRSALLAPSARAPKVLLQLPSFDTAPRLTEFCRQIGSLCQGARPLDPALLKRNQDQAAWQKELQELRRQVETWWKQAPFKETTFAPATYVWRSWVEPQGKLRALLPAQLGETGDLATVKKLIKQWSDERHVRREVNHTDRELIGRSLGQKDIEGDAFKQILDYAREAVDFARRWVSLLENNPGQIKLQPPPQLEPLRQLIQTSQAAVLQELEEAKAQQTSLLVREALAFCHEAVSGVVDLLNPEKGLAESEPKLRYLLNAPLLATGVPVNWRLNPELTDQEALIAGLLKTIAKGLPIDWQRAFAQRSERRDHDATAYIIEYLAETGFDAAKLETMRRDREQMLASCRAVLRQEIEETRKMTATALDLGQLSERDYLSMAAKIDGFENAKLLRFSEAQHEMLAIRQTILVKRETAINGLKEKLKLSGIGPDHYYYPQIARVLERGDAVTAEEYIGMVLDQQEIPEVEENRDNFVNFYPEKAHELSEYLKQVPLYAVIQRARAGADICGLRLKDFDLEAVSTAIAAWFNVRRVQTISEDELKQLLSFLGFVPKEVEIKGGDGHTWVNLTMDPIIGRERSPVPAYGSEAKGKYRILCVWNRPSEEELLQLVGDTSFGSPVIIFYFGQLNDEMRPALARICRERRQTLVVVDDVLILYLYGQRAPRLRVMFECTLPFTWTEPYTATAVSPEMFYGRVQERKSIMSPTGTGFVYGGRRLGKTALLRDVERNFHHPAQHRIAIFRDLEGENIGTQRQLDDLWLLLGEEFKQLKIVNEAHDNPVQMLEQASKWLDANPQRRILVLLDQADRFLEADEKEQFVRASRLRGLMEKTNRRFKVVFAGVHNIPRMTRIPDHPLAQFGTPISIGPLLGHEATEARRLIEEPLAALGYVFESPDLVRRILWRTNYYPSLIQHYCYHLLKYLTNASRHTNDSGPPYLITSEDVDEAYRSQDMRAAIRAGLLLTLQVDERYSVIAYVMADALLQNDEALLTEGFSLGWVKQQVRYWWPEGFDPILKDNALHVLLDEMVGLGILRATERGYTLRSKGVAVLLGNEDQIAAELNRTRKMPPKYNPSTFRAARTGSPRRSPLTAQEIHELRSRQNGLSLIFGTEAAGLADLREFIEVATPRNLCHVIESGERQGFAQKLKSIQDNQTEGTTLVLVTAACAWEMGWIEDASAQLHQSTAARAYTRVAFIADPAKTWRLVNQQITPFELLPGKGTSSYSLKPWHDDALRQWLDDRSFNVDEDARERITAVTGNWPMLLEYFYQRSQIDSLNWMEHLRATAKDLKDKTVARDLARALGFEQAALADGYLNIVRVLLALENHGAQTVEELHQRLNHASGGLPEAAIKTVLWWAELLSLANRVGPRWRADHLVGRILKAVND
jgi:hypothetical protein